MTPTPTKSAVGPRRRAAVALAIGVWLGVLATLYARVPPSPDQFAIQYVAWRVNAGEPLYTDIIDMNWPGIVWLMRPVASLTFDPWFPWRLLDFSIMLAGVTATGLWLRRSFGRAAASAWCITYPLIYTSPALYWFAGQPDAVMTHITLLAIALHVRMAQCRHPNLAGHALLIGITMGIATLIKPLAICFAMALALHALWLTQNHRISRGGLATYLGNATLGGLLTLALGFATVLLDGTDSADAWNAAWVYNRTAQFVGGQPIGPITLDAGRWIWDVWHLGLLLIVLIIPIRVAPMSLQPSQASKQTASRVVLFLALSAAAAASYLLQSKGFAYHLAPAFALVAILWSISLGKAWTMRNLSPALAYSAIVLLGTPFVAAKAAQHLPVVREAFGLLDRPSYLARFEAGDGLTFDQLCELNRSLTGLYAVGQDDEPLMVWGETVALNLYQRRPQPTPFYYFLSLTNLRAQMPMHEPWLERFAQELRADGGPTLGVIADEAVEIARRSGNDSFPLVQGWINSAQTLVTVGHTRIMQREPTPRPDPAADPADASGVAPPAP